MSRIACIVCESSGVWARALRRWLDDSVYRVRETRSLDGLEAAWREQPGCFVVVAAQVSVPEELLSRLCGWRQRRPNGRVAIAGVSETPEWLDPIARSLLAEWSVDATCRSPLDCVALAGLVRRHADVQSEANESLERPRTFRQTIWARLPWEPVHDSSPTSPQGNY